MPAPRPFPVPKKRFQKRQWEVYWYWNKKRYCLYLTGLAEGDELAAEIERTQIAAALAAAEPLFPDKYINTAGAISFTSDRSKDDAPAVHEPPEHWLDSYRKNIVEQCGVEWAKNSLSYLQRLQKKARGNLSIVTPALASSFLDEVQRKTSAATRNRAMAACNRFFNWAIDTNRIRVSPFERIKQLREVRTSEIVYCTREERERIIEAAKVVRPYDWIAVALAFFAGCRRGELFRLEWEDMSLSNRKIQVRISKTGLPRTVPISKTLLDILTKEQQPHGFVIPRAPGEIWESQADSIIDDVREHLTEPAKPGADGRPLGSVGKREFIMSAKEKRFLIAARAEARKTGTLREAFPHDAPLIARDGKEWIPGERIGWTAWRHTFGSLLAQDGVSIDKICSWMGNTPEVCRRHYTQFMPRDKHDEEIDLL